MTDLLIVGGGIVGLSVADCALRDGLSVTIVDKGPVAREASWAGAGMLTCRPWPRAKPAVPEPKTGIVDNGDFTLLSCRLHAEWAERLRAETCIDVGYKVSGALELLIPESSGNPEDNPPPVPGSRAQQLQRLIAGCQERGVRARMIGADDVRRLEPNLKLETEGALEFPDEAQVRNPRLLKALLKSVQDKGAKILEGESVFDVDADVTSGRVRGVLLQDGRSLAAGRVVLCAGAWTGRFPNVAKVNPSIGKIEPVRGQILCYETDPGLASRLLTLENHYIVPRGDGVVLIGATHERAGFVKEATPEGLRELEQFAHSLLPVLKSLKPVRTWVGLRPGLKGRHPIFGRVPGFDGLFLAAGHYRNGLTQAPATATLLLDVILGRTPKIPVELWSVG